MDDGFQYLILIIIWIISTVIKHFAKGKANRDMKELAIRLSLDFDDGGMFSQPRVVGMYEGHEVLIINFTKGSGNNKQQYYKVQMVHDVQFPDAIKVYNTVSFGPVSGLFSELGEIFGIHDIQFDNSVFNQKFVIRGKSQEVAKAVLDQSVQETLIGLGNVNLIIQDADEIFIEEGNAPENESRIRTILTLLARLASNVSMVVSTGVVDSAAKEQEVPARRVTADYAFSHQTSSSGGGQKASIDGLHISNLRADIVPARSDYFPEPVTPEDVIRQMKREGYYTGD